MSDVNSFTLQKDKEECLELVAATDHEGYAKLSLKKYRPIAARNDDKKVFSGLL